MRYVAIGHVCLDVAPGGSVLGGTVAYSALTARALGWEVAVVTRAHTDLDLSPLRGVDCARLPDAVTTTFENIYSPAGRTQILYARAGPIHPGDAPDRYRRADVAHLAPIADEVDPAWLDAFDGALIGVTPQGWLRQWDATGRVSPREWTDAALLRRVDAIVLSIDDVSGDWALVGRWAGIARVLVTTQGREGCTVYVDGAPTHVPTPAVVEVDPTGAGDVFAAAYFIRLRTTGDALEAARFANCIAAHSVTRRGLTGMPALQEVKACLAGARQAPAA
jgi:sugar/nucleoside kinase (ribokinase family)